MTNPIKTLAIINLLLLVGLIAFILLAKQKTEGGEKVGYFIKSKEDLVATEEIETQTNL